MIRKNILGFAMAFTVVAGIGYGQNGHGSHTAGTIGAVGNNGVASGDGVDLLIGGRTSFESQIIHICTAAAQLTSTYGRGAFAIRLG